ncbi:MAG: dihydrodipicolinate synthase family protein [Verrucomicrobia bacterium]|nr:dihydrodipicolinate synthase family protein [Verrucomicrobiota bacterium]
MRPLTASEIRGNWATLLLPLNADDSIDYGLLATELDHFIAARVSGVYSNGTAGEFHTQTEDEFDRVNQLLAEKCERAGVPFQVGASHMSAQLSRARLRRAKALRPTAFQVVLPDWQVPAWPEIVTFLETMAAEAAPIPLIVYNPPHAKRRLVPEEWLRLIEAVPGIAGMKVAGGDDAWYRAMQPVMARVSVFIPGHTLASGLARGAHGAYSNVACLSPAGAQRWYDLCQRDPAAGLAWENKIQPFWMSHIAPIITQHGLTATAADKSAAAAGGWLRGFTPRVRWPHRSAGAEQIAAIAAAARREVPELFEG